MLRRSVVLLLLAVAPAHAAFPVVDNALCIAQSGPQLLAMAPEGREAMLGALQDIGWQQLRVDFTWSQIEPTRGALSWGAYDDLVARAKAHGIKLIGVLDYGAPWAARASGGDEYFPPDNPAEFARFAGDAARRYRRSVPAWEIWNEPNLGGVFWKPQVDPAGYARLSGAAAKAIRGAFRKATIVTGGLAPTIDFMNYGRDWGFFAAVAQSKRGWWKRFNGAAIHPFTYLDSPAPEVDSNDMGPSVKHQIANFGLRLAGAKASRLGTWVTEIGWYTAPDSGDPTYPPGVSEDDQARYLVRSATLALAGGAQRYCWYTLSDYANFAHDKDAAFGLVRWQESPAPGTLVPKPAYLAAQIFAKELKGTQFVRDLRADLQLPSQAYALCFQSTTKTTIVLWSAGDPVPVVTSALGTVRVVNMAGEETTPGNINRIQLSLGPDPIYLVSSGSTQ